MEITIRTIHKSYNNVNTVVELSKNCPSGVSKRWENSWELTATRIFHCNAKQRVWRILEMLSTTHMSKQSPSNNQLKIKRPIQWSRKWLKVVPKSIRLNQKASWTKLSFSKQSSALRMIRIDKNFDLHHDNFHMWFRIKQFEHMRQHCLLCDDNKWKLFHSPRSTKSIFHLFFWWGAR